MIIQMTTAATAALASTLEVDLEVENAAQENEVQSSSYRQAYHEIADQHVVETDALETLRANIAQLEDLHGRLRYMMGEITYLMKRS